MSKTIEIVKAKDFKVGDKIRGYEDGKYCDIQITAIGESHVLAKCLTHGDRETTWTLEYREWEKLK